MIPVIALMGPVASHELMHRTLRQLNVSGVPKTTTHSGDKETETYSTVSTVPSVDWYVNVLQFLSDKY